jgi:hypothetical protein
MVENMQDLFELRVGLFFSIDTRNEEKEKFATRTWRWRQ